MKQPSWQAGRRDGAARILIVGGEDVEKRLDLMRSLSDRFRFAAAGSDIQGAQAFVDAGFPFFYYPMDRGTNPLNDARTFFFLGRILRRLQPDLVHAFATKPAVWGRLAARWAGVPAVVGTLPGLGSLYSFNDFRTRIARGLYQPLQRRACQSADLTIFQNRADMEQFVDAGIAPGGRSAVIPGSGVRTDLFAPSPTLRSEAKAFRREVGAEDGDIVVTMIARLIRSKGVREFARAANLLSGREIRTRFVLVGPEDAESWDALSPRELHDAKASVVWLGARPDVKTVYAGSDIFALASYREGMPRVLLEAASMRLPLVAARNPGSEAVIEDGQNGFLVDVGDAEALAERIYALARQPLLRKRFAREARIMAVRQFDHTVIARMTASHYDRLLAAVEPSARPRPPERLDETEDELSGGTASA